MIETWNVTIPKLTGKAERRAYVYLPNALEEEPDARYPVLYMFDGHNVFFDEDATYGKSWGLGDYLDANDTPLIVAAVECSHDTHNGRLSEYSPFTFQDEEFGRVRGRGRTTMEWMVHEFKPFIDENFPTLPDRSHTFIAGSSMGGLMSLYALLAYNWAFSRAAALSPSLWCSHGRIEQLIRRSEIDPETVLYMDYGSEELVNHQQMLQQFSHAAKLLLDRGVLLDCRIVPGGEHCEASWERQIPFFINTLLYE
ncbi:MAG: alpha/beta hydrolase [Oscillospiraceae bacterium]